ARARARECAGGQQGVRDRRDLERPAARDPVARPLASDGMTTLPEDQRLAGISPKAYEHPADRAATAALKAVPMLDTVVRKLIEWGYERALRQSFLGNAVRVGDSQLPDLWASHNGVCRILDMPEVYDLYVSWGILG